ncbi:MAG TPA: molybdate ABC transporter substrate-binding protein [Jatrophihabitans sp.]|jgi:molybdate transport system substrate-binding protein|uniref:molybdate ABC transporter substrate-binding protein n=1 Tax=Jatrophihabitans sp. TaxID=1932789 RepID=UPI002DFCB4C2|nr:molybdate ABC transporter substrate-binding protein [Jatrophihabitans sp.]
MKRPVALSAVVALLVAGCSSSASSPGVNSSGPPSSGALYGSITVLAAASLTDAFTTLKNDFLKAHPGVRVSVTFGASSDLATQINDGAPADVFASASEKNMKTVSSASSAQDFVSNTLEIATPPDNPGRIASVADLAKPDVKVAVCAAAVPCGVVAQKVFTRAKITVTPVASLADVKSTLAAVESGEVDAGLVYVTDVRSAGAKVKGVPIPAAVNASTKYPIAALSGSKNAALAKAFVDYVLSVAGRNVLTADGFSAP